MSKKAFITTVIIEALLAVVLVGLFLHSVSLNANDEKEFADPDQADIINCAEGILSVNNVAAVVPVDKNVSYNISYSWAKSDTEFPTVPRAAIASYYSDSGDILYELTLYKNSFTENAKIPTGKASDTWFNDWDGSNDEEHKVKQGKLDTKNVHGFYISTLDRAIENSHDNPPTYTYYFSVPDKDGVYVYVFEAILRDPTSASELQAVINKCLDELQLVETDDSIKKNATTASDA